MKKFLFLICFLFTFFNVAKAIPIPAKEKQANEKQKAKSESLQIAILAQNQMLFKAFVFGKTTDHFAGYVVRYKKERFFVPIAGKPCKIPIPLRTRNKDNI